MFRVISNYPYSTPAAAAEKSGKYPSAINLSVRKGIRSDTLGLPDFSPSL